MTAGLCAYGLASGAAAQHEASAEGIVARQAGASENQPTSTKAAGSSAVIYPANMNAFE